MTPEQEQLRADLLAEYGEALVQQAIELSGLAMCLAGLAADELTSEERARLYRQASIHLGQLLSTSMPAAVSAKLTECALRFDAALDLWMLDGIEQREELKNIFVVDGVLKKRGGLPPLS